MKILTSLVLFACTSARLLASEYQPIVPFLNTYCVECHGPDEQEADIRLDDVYAIGASLWIDVYDQISEGDMPPSKAKQPAADKLKDIVKLVDKISRDERITVATGYRRLNKREYRNTVRDLLGLENNKLFDPATFIYEDEIEEGFDTNSENLVITNELLLEYLRSAQISLKTALNIETTEQPKKKLTTYNHKKLRANGQLSGKRGNGVVLRTSNGFISVDDPEKAITVSGNYRIKVSAAGVNRIVDNKHTRPANLPGKGVAFRMGIGGSFKGQSQLYKEFDLEDNTFTEKEAVIWLDKGSTLQVLFLNGSRKPRNVTRRTPKEHMVPNHGLAVKEITIEGPLNVEWPPRTYKTTYHSDEMPNFMDDRIRRKILNNFISRAFRRNVSPAEQDKYYQYLELEYQKDQNWQESLIRTFAVIMASTDFLYIKEDLGKLNGFQLANRLSYLLWSTMPDIELFRLAHSGKILEPETYQAQVKRLLQDPRANQFAESFASQWLSIDQLGEMRPNEEDKQYKVYFRDRLEESMRKETLMFFKHILFNNLPITDFLDSDYTFLNQPLANLYELPFQPAEDIREMKLTKLPPNSIRGGLLGQASIHAVTSNGVETLPVTRGHWVLDELMGTPPPPAPEEVPALVPDLTGVDTPRAQLDRHREDPKCFSCHQLMDPPGLALENFDIIGRFRKDYGGRKTRIDASGKYRGTSFNDIRGLRQALLKNKQTFTVNFIARIAEYAKGRKLNRQDMELVHAIAKKAPSNDYQFMTILNEIMLSDLMLSR